MAMLDGLQFIHTSRPLLRPGIDGIAHADLSVHATVEAVVPHRLGHQQDGDRQQAQGADGSQNGMAWARTISLVVRDWLVWSDIPEWFHQTDHALDRLGCLVPAV